MIKVAMIGAGSLGFARRLIIDILSFPALRECTFALMDIDTKRLDYTRRVAERIIRETGYPAKVEVTQNRREALKDADYVITMVLIGGYEAIVPDIEIPLKYGVDQCISDTLGPGGVFRCLRTVPVLVGVAKEMEELCPNALLINYTNPMAMLCWAISKATTIRNVGLCHSVQGNAHYLAHLIGKPQHECSHWVAGINHQAWFLKFLWNGEDAYPMLHKRFTEDEEIWRGDTTRVEMYRHLGYFVTESSGHNSEYNPWFRKRKDLIEKYCPGGGWNGGTGFILQLYGGDRANYEAELEQQASGTEPLDLNRSEEYGSSIINACETDQTFRFNGNVTNTGLITNLQEGCNVEVPCYVDRLGIHPCYVGDLPPQLAALNRMNVTMQEMAVRAALEADKDMAYWACAYDPLTAAVCSLAEIKAMVNELFEAETQYMPQFQ